MMSRAPPPPHWVSDMHPYPPGPGYHGPVKKEESAWERGMKNVKVINTIGITEKY